MTDRDSNAPRSDMTIEQLMQLRDDVREAIQQSEAKLKVVDALLADKFAKLPPEKGFKPPDGPRPASP